MQTMRRILVTPAEGGREKERKIEKNEQKEMKKIIETNMLIISYCILLYSITQYYLT